MKLILNLDEDRFSEMVGRGDRLDGGVTGKERKRDKECSLSPHGRERPASCLEKDMYPGLIYLTVIKR